MITKLKYVFIGACLLVGAEVIARQMERGDANDALFNYFFYDEQLLRKDMIEQGGIFEHGRQVRLNSRGFRDSKTWPPSPEKSNKRIVLGGAGHGFGENIGDGFIYAHLLERSLKRKNNSVEVYNLSVQGSTILFFERALLDEVVAVKPDVVILTYTGFNEALFSFLPERDVLFPHNKAYNMAMSSALVRRIHLWLFAQSTKVNRVTPNEMIASYERIVSTLRAQNIEVMLLQQVVIHPDIEGLWSLAEMERYRLRIEQLAKVQRIPLADPLPFCQVLEQCFERLEWYSGDGHRAAARALEPHHSFLLGK